MHYVSHLPSNPGSGRREKTCFSRVDQGPLVVVGACVLKEKHHGVFHVSGLVLEGGKEGGREGGREGGEKGWRRDGGRERGRGVGGGRREGGREGEREGKEEVKN